MTLCILGVDPGSVSGAIAFFFPIEDAIFAEDMPVADKRVDVATLAQRIAQMKPTFAVVEMVHSFPKQGVASSFKFGEAYGAIKGIVASLQIPMHLVAPTVWKKKFNLGPDKEKSRALALQYWPASTCFGRRKDHGRAEAAILARYGYTHIHAGNIDCEGRKA